MYDICFYSDLPFWCDFCPEDSAPCLYMTEKRKQNEKKLICNHSIPRSVFDLNYKKVSLDNFQIVQLFQLCKE